MTVIKADRTYPIYSVPASRSYDNFLIKYTLTYSTDEAGNNNAGVIADIAYADPDLFGAAIDLKG